MMYSTSTEYRLLPIHSTLVIMFLCFAISCYGENAETRMRRLLTQIPKNTYLRERILTTLFCEDCHDIPKCKNAGQILYENNENYQLMHNGIKIIPDCYYGQWMTLLITMLEGHHEPQEEKAFYDVLPSLPRGAVMVELGSYWGYYSLWFHKIIPDANTYLIEPDHNNLRIGQKNFALNQYEADFTHAMVGNVSCDQCSFTNWDYETCLVSQIALDDFVKNKHIPYIHILHSDIQGAEISMLEGCKNLIQDKRIGYFFISTHRGTHEKCLEILENSEYEILLSITREESFSADGLIVAKSTDIEGPSTFEVTKRTKDIQNLLKRLIDEELVN